MYRNFNVYVTPSNKLSKQDISKKMEIKYYADQQIIQALSEIKRAECIQLSHDRKRIAIADTSPSCIHILDVDFIDGKVTIDKLTNINSSELNFPHGLSFIDSTTLLVCNRFGGINIFKIPDNKEGCLQSFTLTPVKTIPSNLPSIVNPSGVAIIKNENNIIECLIINTQTSFASKLFIDTKKGFELIDSEILLKNELNFPDAIDISEDGKCIAICNHHNKKTFVYENKSNLNVNSVPDAVLTGFIHPHGVCIINDNYIAVTSASDPYVRLFFNNNKTWKGTYTPYVEIKLMDAQSFEKFKAPRDGGIKGITLVKNTKVIALTGGCFPLKFYDLSDYIDNHVFKKKLNIFTKKIRDFFS